MIKIFDINKVSEQEINEFLNDHVLEDTPIVFRDDRIFVFYTEEGGGELSKNDQIHLLTRDLNGIIEKRLENERLARYFRDEIMNAKDETTRRQNEDGLKKLERQIEADNVQIRMYREMIVDVNNGKLVI